MSSQQAALGCMASAPSVSVITPSIPERERYLEELIASAEAQTFKNFEHIWQIDYSRLGCAWMVNHLAEKAKGEWLLICADDDLLLPRCIETLMEYADDADIVYSPPLVWGSDSKHFFQAPPYIPSFGLIYMDLWREIGGYKDVSREEDRQFWIEAMRLGAKFVRADKEPTWVYRLHPGNKSFNEGIAS